MVPVHTTIAVSVIPIGSSVQGTRHAPCSSIQFGAHVRACMTDAQRATDRSDECMVMQRHVGTIALWCDGTNTERFLVGCLLDIVGDTSSLKSGFDSDYTRSILRPRRDCASAHCGAWDPP
mmetsp:Transcript_10272/g.26982  ORF Transcript_10272/g.26982 Transcript_10272/m.26982 type:complete len:121 (-) Transcript_10272:62-424(-)